MNRPTEHPANDAQGDDPDWEDEDGEDIADDEIVSEGMNQARGARMQKGDRVRAKKRNQGGNSIA